MPFGVDILTVMDLLPPESCPPMTQITVEFPGDPGRRTNRLEGRRHFDLNP